MDDLATHFAVMGFIDLHLHGKETSSEHLKSLQVDKRAQCIAKCGQKYLQALSALARVMYLKTGTAARLPWCPIRDRETSNQRSSGRI